MKSVMLLVTVFFFSTVTAQRNYSTPVEDALPEKLQDLRQIILVNSFPQKIDPVKIDDQYYWKHNTAILCTESELEIIEFGAYLFYNGKWNLRKSYPLKDLDRNFGTKKQRLKRAQPYTWNNNWRVGPQLFGGWALWYFIGKTPTGELVCGYEKIETTANLLNN